MSTNDTSTHKLMILWKILTVKQARKKKKKQKSYMETPNHLHFSYLISEEA